MNANGIFPITITASTPIVHSLHSCSFTYISIHTFCFPTAATTNMQGLRNNRAHHGHQQSRRNRRHLRLSGAPSVHREHRKAGKGTPRAHPEAVQDVVASDGAPPGDDDPAVGDDALDHELSRPLAPDRSVVIEHGWRRATMNLGFVTM
mmetsp:Transcript_2208/g.5663  ORF Transcript_2208/g.5663 Transcript_2208/m.5663 type:complete len:149 (-) Transcript_2208:1963-2409(-)